MTISRREMLIASGGLASGLVFGFNIAAAKPSTYPHPVDGALQPNAFLQVTPNNRVVLQIHKCEMGQGILTGLTTLVAEEMNMAPSRIHTEFAAVHADYLNPQFEMQITNASSSMITCYTPLREAAATVRSLLLQAAADEWGVEPKELQLAHGFVKGKGKRAPLGALVARAAALPLPANVTLKPRHEFTYIGKFDRRLDSASKVDGSARFGLDIQLPNALHAVVVRSPHFHGELKHFDAAAAKKARGVSDVFAIESGVAVVADSYWHARQAATLLEVAWDIDASVQESSTTIAHEQSRLLDEKDLADGPLVGNQIISAEYTAPFQAHACMEPMNATANVTDDGADVWVATQAPDIMRSAAAAALQLSTERVIVHSTYAGGGFGRRVYPQAVVEAVLISQKMGAPIKLIWSREDDIRHDKYRPAVKCRMSARIDGAQVKHWRYRICTPSLHETLLHGIRARLFPPEVQGDAFAAIIEQAMADDIESIETPLDTPYRYLEKDVQQVMWQPGIPVSFWRSVGHSFNGFFVESFMDELAFQARTDPVEFRHQCLRANSRPRKVLDRLATLADWGNTAAEVSQGVAIDVIKGTVCGQIADVRVVNGEILVDRIVCVVDPGMVINPDIAATQVESCIVWGLTDALKSEVTIADRATVQSNFNDFPVLRIDETPRMVVDFIESGDHPAGVGECAVAPVAPAIANAVFRATGTRLRSLPLRLPG